MGKFPDPLVLERTGRDTCGRPIRRLSERFRYSWGVSLHEGGQIWVPRGFETDLSSVPRVFWRLIPPTVGEQAAVIHDFLYREGWESRALCDAIFRQALADAGVDPFRRWLMWAAVRLFGRTAYRGKRCSD